MFRPLSCQRLVKRKQGDVKLVTCLQSEMFTKFWPKNLKVKYHFANVGVDERII